MEKILCPVNFTDTALNAIEYASSLANVHQGSLTLYHVVTNEEYNEMLESGTGDLPEHLKRRTQELEKRLYSLLFARKFPAPIPTSNVNMK